MRAWAPTATSTEASHEQAAHAEGSQPLNEHNTTAWRECAQRTPRNDRWRCSLDASGRTRGRVLQEGLPPVFGLHADASTTTQDDAADTWIVVMDNDRASPDDVLRMCDPEVEGTGGGAARG